jgi:ABC-2 type transport system permease protein
MIRLIKAEFQKILTVRSTYYLLGFCLLLTFLISFYIEGLRNTHDILDSGKLASEAVMIVGALSLLLSLVGAMLLTHEYRYNTIMYTLTSSNSRLKVLLAKIVAVSGFALLAALFFGALAPVLTAYGVHLKGYEMVQQTIPFLDILWRSLFFAWAYAMLALIIAFIIRNQIGTIVSILLIPSTAETLLTLLIKEKASYLPFRALNNVLGNMPERGLVAMSHGESALIVLAYILAGGLIAAFLFQRRDAS